MTTNNSWNSSSGSPVNVPNGGTGLATFTSGYGLICSGTTATGTLQNAGTGTSGQILQGNGASALPTFSTATYPSTTTISQLLYSSSANVVAGLATANNGVLVTSAGGVPSISSTLPSAVITNIAGRLINIQFLTSGSAATYSPTSGTNKILVLVVGGGGGSGGVNGSGTTSSASGGGGAGGYCIKYITSITGTYTYTVGTAGAAGLSGTNTGSTGGTSSFSNGTTTLSAVGGAGGVGGSNVASGSNTAAAGGLGGSATGGDLNYVGNSGFPGFALANTLAIGGPGGQSIFGYGTRGGVQIGTGFAGGDNAGNNSGGGGGGSATITNNPSAGQTGGTGMIIVYEYS